MNKTARKAAIPGWYFEDFEAGAVIRTQGRTITETDLVLAVALTGHSQPLFVDEEFAKKTVFGTRIAPGEFTIGVLAGLLTRTGILENQVGLLEIHCRFPNALRAGDTVHAEAEILETRLASAGDRGIVTFRDRVLNHRGEIVLETRRVALFLARP